MEQANSTLIMFSHLAARDGEGASEVGACYFFRGENHHRPNQRVSLMKYGSKIQICFSKVRRSLGVYFP